MECWASFTAVTYCDTHLIRMGNGDIVYIVDSDGSGDHQAKEGDDLKRVTD